MTFYFLCCRALGDAEQVTITGICDGHDTRTKVIHNSLSNHNNKCIKDTHPTRKSFPAAVPRATLVPPKWCTVVFDNMA